MGLSKYSSDFRLLILRSIRKEYPKGSRVMLVKMDDPFRKIPKGTLGTVRSVDDIGTIHVNWDNGSTLGVVYGEDTIIRATWLNRLLSKIK